MVGRAILAFCRADRLDIIEAAEGTTAPQRLRSGLPPVRRWRCGLRPPLRHQEPVRFVSSAPLATTDPTTSPGWTTSSGSCRFGPLRRRSGEGGSRAVEVLCAGAEEPDQVVPPGGVMMQVSRLSAGVGSLTKHTVMEPWSLGTPVTLFTV